MQGPHFLIQVEDNPTASAARAIVAAEYTMFSRFAHEDFGSYDYEETVMHLSKMSGRGKVRSDAGLFSYVRLHDLPGLRALQDEHMLLDVQRLETVDSTLHLLGVDPDPAHLEAADKLLVDLFTPKRPRQELPGPTTITRRLRALIARLNPDTDFDPKKRKEREEKARGKDEVTQVNFYDHHDGQQLKAGMEVDTDPVVMETFKARAESVAKEEKVSVAEAVEKLLCGESDPKITLYAFTPLDETGKRIAGTPFYLRGCGWTDADGTARLEEMADRAKQVPLDGEQDAVTDAYKPTQTMRAYVEARDGTCVYPGCGRDASGCQLDHRIPFEAGGPTTPGNLFALCQKHHNMKTDKSAFYIPDPATGEIVWLFGDGTYQIVQPEGMLYEMTTPLNPRWASTLDRRKDAKAKNTQFFAMGHKLLDDYRIHRDRERCEREIAQLEHDHGKEFGFEPDDLFRPLDRISELL